MSALESLISTGGEAPMIDSLDFTLPPASTAVVDRRQHVRAYPSSASTLTLSGTKNARIRLGGDDFVDASSIRLMYTINETGGSLSLDAGFRPLGRLVSALPQKQRRGIGQHPPIWTLPPAVRLQSATFGSAVRRGCHLWHGRILGWWSNWRRRSLREHGNHRS